MSNCPKCGAGKDKQLTHEGFGGRTVILCKACGAERSST